MLRVLIAEDNIIIAKDIAKSLQQFNCEVVAIAASAEDAIEKFDALEPSLVMIDIELEGEKDGIDLAAHINATCRVPFIFLTDHFGAHNRYFKRANEVMPSGYLPKGTFLPNQLWHFVEMAMTSFASGGMMIKEEEVGMFLRNRFFVKNNKAWEKVHAEAITHIVAAKPYCQLFIWNKKGRYLVRKSLDYVIEQLNSIPLLRTSRGCAINANHIFQFHPTENKITLGDLTEVELSRNYAESFKQQIRFLT